MEEKLEKKKDKWEKEDKIKIFKEV